MVDNKLSHLISLANGRMLGYAEFGSADGFPIIYLTGGKNSRIEGQWFSTAAKNKMGIAALYPTLLVSIRRCSKKISSYGMAFMIKWFQ